MTLGQVALYTLNFSHTVLHIILSLPANLERNFLQRSGTVTLGRINPKFAKASTTSGLLPVRNNFISKRTTKKSRNNNWAFFKEDASLPYNKMGRQLVLIKWTITSSLDEQPSLPIILFTALLNERFTESTEQKLRELTMVTPR